MPSGQALRDRRRARGLTLRTVADRVGVSAATLSAIENGKSEPSPARVSAIEEVLDGDERRPPPAAAHGGWRDFPPLPLDPALTGALSAFVELGYHGASMRAIAEGAGLSVPGLYHHYASKQEILVALLDLAMADLHAHTDAARRDGADAVERFRNLVECQALFHTHRRDLAFVAASEMRSLEPGHRRRLADLRMEEQRLVDAEVEAAVTAGDFGTAQPHEAARAVVTMCTALAQWFRHDGPVPAERVAEQYAGFALALVSWRGSAA